MSTEAATAEVQRQLAVQCAELERTQQQLRELSEQYNAAVSQLQETGERCLCRGVEALLCVAAPGPAVHAAYGPAMQRPS